jgi:adenylate kinase family enzyme
VTSDGFVLALAGPPAAGKTTVAAAVCQRTGARRVGFGDFVRAHAAEQGIESGRDALQRLGTHLLDDLGPSAFILAALDAAGVDSRDRPVVWDAVRHLSVLDALDELYDDPVRLVFLDPPADARRHRLKEAGADEQAIQRWDADSTERDREALAQRANLLCTAAAPRQAIEQTLALIGL